MRSILASYIDEKFLHVNISKCMLLPFLHTCLRYDYLGEVNKSLQKTLLNPFLSTFSEALVSSLAVQDSHNSDTGLKTQVDTNDSRQGGDWFKSSLKTSRTKSCRVFLGGLM